MDDDFGADADFVAALAASESGASSRPGGQVQQPSRGVRQPSPQRIAQPTPQRLDRAPPGNGSGSGSKIVQPTPQALPSRGSGSSILVSPRQKGNPVLANLRSMPWEYSDIPADYGLGLTTCALFLRYVWARTWSSEFTAGLQSVARCSFGQFQLEISPFTPRVYIYPNPESARKIQPAHPPHDGRYPQPRGLAARVVQDVAR